MTAMKKLVFLLMVLLPISAGAQAPAVNSDDSYDFILAKLAAEDGRYDEALAKVDKLVAKNPADAVLQYERALILVDAPRIDEPHAGGCPVSGELQGRRACLSRRAGETEKARAELKALVDADPKDTRSLFYLAEAYNDLEQYSEADKLYRKLLEATPDDPDVLASYALSQIGQHKYDEAAKTLQAMQKLPDLPENLQVLAKTQLAFIDLQKGNYAEAIDEARPVLVFHDKPNAQAINTALEAMKKEKHYADAVALLQPLVDKYASDPFVNARYVEFLLRAGDKDRARVAASTQAKFGVRNTVGAAEAYVQNEQYDAAVTLLQDALKAKPDEVDLQFELGSTYERAGKKA